MPPKVDSEWFRASHSHHHSLEGKHSMESDFWRWNHNHETKPLKFRIIYLRV